MRRYIAVAEHIRQRQIHLGLIAQIQYKEILFAWSLLVWVNGGTASDYLTASVTEKVVVHKIPF